jgi:hypothetical protein
MQAFDFVKREQFVRAKTFKYLLNLFRITCLVFSGITTLVPIASADSGTISQTSYTDFAQGCTTLSQNTSHVSDEGGGGVELAATLSGDFPGTTLDTTNWTSGKWEPLGDPYTPTITSSVLTIN